MKYQVDQTVDGLRVQANVRPDQQEQLLREFSNCAAGTCSCPSTQYEKLTSIEVEQTSDGVRVDLRARPGETIDVDDIKRCLDHTATKLDH